MLQVVVDRVQHRRTISAQRLTDSIETAYREGGGAALRSKSPSRFGAGRRAPAVFSERFECRRCGIAYEDPQPRLFSFNNPFGACPTCHGFGNIIELDMDLVVPDPTEVDPRRARSSRGASRITARSSPSEDAPPNRLACRSTCRGTTSRRSEKRFVIEGDGRGLRGRSADSSTGSSGRNTRCTSACSSAATADI